MFCYGCVMLEFEGSDSFPEFLVVIYRCNDLILCFGTWLIACSLCGFFKIMKGELGIWVTCVSRLLLLNLGLFCAYGLNLGRLLSFKVFGFIESLFATKKVSVGPVFFLVLCIATDH